MKSLIITAALLATLYYVGQWNAARVEANMQSKITWLKYQTKQCVDNRLAYDEGGVSYREDHGLTAKGYCDQYADIIQSIQESM